MFRKEPPKQRTHYGSNSETCADNSQQWRHLFRRRTQANDQIRTRGNPSTSYPGDCPPDDERSRIRSNRADQTADFEDEDRDEEDGFDGEVLVRLAKAALEGGYGHEEAGAIPATAIITVSQRQQ
jgi:hypothetical protein